VGEKLFSGKKKRSKTCNGKEITTKRKGQHNKSSREGSDDAGSGEEGVGEN